MELMADPVVVATGHTYDRRCIERWLGAGRGTCPATGARLRHLELTPNFALRDAVTEWALREGVPVPVPEDGSGRTAAALLYKGGAGGVGGDGEQEGGRSGDGGGEGSSISSSRRRAAAAAAAAAAAVLRFADEEATPAATEGEEEGEQEEAPRRRQQQQHGTTPTAAPGSTSATNTDAPPLLQPPPTILRGHDEIVWAVEAQAQAGGGGGGRLFSASADRSVRVWDVSSRRCEAVLEDHARPVLCLALALAADAVGEEEEGVEKASGSNGGGEEPSGPGDGEEGEGASGFEGDDLLFSGSYDFTIKAWSLRTLSRVATLTGHGDAVRSLLYVPPPKKGGSGGSERKRNSLGRRGRLFSASYDGTVRVWDVATLSALAALPGHSGPVRTLASVDGLVFSGSYDKTVRWKA
jgi:F-box/WD-40 domain protein 7